jgi:hypothetical protein
VAAFFTLVGQGFATFKVLTIMSPGAVAARIGMLMRLTKAVRSRVASAVALLYMLCVLAPVAAFAFGDGSRAAHCITDDNHGLRSAHVHTHDAGKVHVHEDGTSHEHSKPPDGKSSDGQCCGLVCLSALPASISEVETPSLPALVAVSDNQEDVAGRTPDRLYRPPISPLSL